MATTYLLVKIEADEQRHVSAAMNTIRRVVHAHGTNEHLRVSDMIASDSRPSQYRYDNRFFKAVDDVFTTEMNFVRGMYRKTKKHSGCPNCDC